MLSIGVHYDLIRRNEMKIAGFWFAMNTGIER
jgi:hypothetical protein